MFSFLHKYNKKARTKENVRNLRKKKHDETSANGFCGRIAHLKDVSKLTTSVCHSENN